MEAKIQYLLSFLQKIDDTHPQKRKKGRTYTYSQIGMLLFFIVMALKRIHEFKKMHRYMQIHYRIFGFSTPPSRKTIRDRFTGMPVFVACLLPRVAESCLKERRGVFGYAESFIDKSVFRALGGIWHRKHMILGVVPHSCIDTEASWAKSPYHKWRFGYGLHVVCNAARFPIAACVTTASTKDYHVFETLLYPIKHLTSLILGDAGYAAVRYLKKLYNDTGILLLTKTKSFLGANAFIKLYNDLRGCYLANFHYARRKPSIEPLFSLIKGVFSLQGENQLPYKGLKLVAPYLMITVAAVQLLMIYNYDHKIPLQDTSSWIEHFR